MLQRICLITLTLYSFLIAATATANLKCRENEVLVTNATPCSDRFCPRDKASLHQQCMTEPFVRFPPRCVCRFNYSRNRRGKCIPTRSCPPIHCGPNEVFDVCPLQCLSDDCSHAKKPWICPGIGRIGIVVQCYPQCRCKPHYWRKNNVCVPYDECPTQPIQPVPRSCNASITII